jgi:WD40 repeat protein
MKLPAPTINDGRVSDLSLSENGERLLLLMMNGPPRVWDVAAAGYLKLPTEIARRSLSGAISDDARLIAVQDSDGNLKLWNVLSGEVLRLPGADLPARVAFSHDGTWLAGNSRGTNLFVWNTRTGYIAYTVAGHAGHTTAFSFSPDGTLLRPLASTRRSVLRRSSRALSD